MSWEITKQLIASIIRWALTSLATFLVTKGIVDPALADAWLNEATSILVGVLIFVAVAGWKYLNARYNVLALIYAVQTDPPADTPREVAAAVAEVKAEVKANNTVSAV